MKVRTGFVSNSSSSSFIVVLDHGADSNPILPSADWKHVNQLVNKLGFRFVNCGARDFIFRQDSCEPKDDIMSVERLRLSKCFDERKGISLNAFVFMEEGERAELMRMGVPFIEWHEHGTWLVTYDGKSGKYLKIHNLPTVWGLYHGFGSMMEKSFINNGAEYAIQLVDIGEEVE